MKNDCIFCKIIKNEISADIIGQTELALAFRDINPQAPTHVLVIPKKHIQSSIDLNEDNIHYLSEMIFLAQNISLDESIIKKGYRWIINTGNHGGQTVHHLHLHVMGGRNMTWPPG